MFVSKVSSLLLGPINGLFIPSPENSIVSLLYFVPNSRSNGKMGTANRVHYRGGALQGHDHCTLFVTCCRHPVYSSRTFPSTFLLFVWRQKLLICYHHFPVLARYTYLLLKDLVRYILNGDYLSRTLKQIYYYNFSCTVCLFDNISFSKNYILTFFPATFVKIAPKLVGGQDAP